jgi:hypothetical protein
MLGEQLGEERYRIGSSLESVPLKSKMTAPGAIGRRSLGYSP